MLKNIIAPVQAWLLSQGRCVGCGTDLKKGKREKKSGNDMHVTCHTCGRIYTVDTTTGRYRRAPLLLHEE